MKTLAELLDLLEKDQWHMISIRPGSDGTMSVTINATNAVLTVSPTTEKKPRPVRVGDRLTCRLAFGDGFKPDTFAATEAHTTDPGAHVVWRHEDGTPIEPYVAPDSASTDREKK